ncbi:MAG: ion transporter [Deltaproteobacteria bacterium]|jgi:voltage-gated potassium channel|nr:ion transporter [Deltaproteobacteria bacterium]MBW2652389.1 ion transporter [Deltaproteobacteria bacterium]MCK5011616.1 ion transporter [Deltaproteobacteria bacterium]MCK5421719.1 ion transporter [Deltaproteobacteria bacterium]
MLSKVKQRINFYFDDLTTPMGKTFDLVIIALIFLVCIIFVIKTYNIPERLREIVNLIETIIIVIFIIEYLLRFWVAARKLKFFFNIYSLIDLAAILPIFFAQQYFQVIRVFRTLRILRMIRFLEDRHFFFGSIKAVHLIIFRISYIMFAIVFVSSGLIFYTEHNINPENFRTFFDGVYFSIVTLTTVGFGDITPLSDYGRVITILIIISGILFIPWQVRNLIANFIFSINKASLTCKECGLEYHDRDAVHCKRCGSKIYHKQESI